MTKTIECGILSKSSKTRMTPAEAVRRKIKKLKKSFKKGLDKRSKPWYNKQAVSENAVANRSLKIEQQCTKRLRKF
ncbi:MAG: hypothetical protein ACI4V1_01185, partial [Eubacteriales bacterium]